MKRQATRPTAPMVELHGWNTFAHSNNIVMNFVFIHLHHFIFKNSITFSICPSLKTDRPPARRFKLKPAGLGPKRVTNSCSIKNLNCFGRLVVEVNCFTVRRAKAPLIFSKRRPYLCIWYAFHPRHGYRSDAAGTVWNVPVNHPAHQRSFLHIRLPQPTFVQLKCNDFGKFHVHPILKEWNVMNSRWKQISSSTSACRNGECIWWCLLRNWMIFLGHP